MTSHATREAMDAALAGRLTVGHIVAMALEASSVNERTRANVQRAPRTAWCWLCRRATTPGRTIDTVEDGPQSVCDECWEREYVTVPLDYTEDEDEPEPLWGDGGPKVGQVITIVGTSMQTRWTGTHWELVD